LTQAHRDFSLEPGEDNDEKIKLAQAVIKQSRDKSDLNKQKATVLIGTMGSASGMLRHKDHAVLFTVVHLILRIALMNSAWWITSGL
jgi:hypothetical protein